MVRSVFIAQRITGSGASATSSRGADQSTDTPCYECEKKEEDDDDDCYDIVFVDHCCGQQVPLRRFNVLLLDFDVFCFVRKDFVVCDML